MPTGPPDVDDPFAQDSTTIVFSWNPPRVDLQNGVIREYRVQVQELETGNYSLYTSFSTSIELSSLHPDYTYDLRVAAVTIAIGPYSDVVNVTTPEDGKFGLSKIHFITCLLLSSSQWTSTEYQFSVINIYKCHAYMGASTAGTSEWRNNWLFG